MTLTLGGTTKCRNNSLVPPPHTESEPLKNAAVFHSSTTIWRRSCMVAMVTLVRTALPSLSHNCPMGFRPGMHAVQAKRSPGLLQTRTLPSTFSYTLPVCSQWHGLYPQVTNVAWIMVIMIIVINVRETFFFKYCETIGVNWAQKIEQYTE